MLVRHRQSPAAPPKPPPEADSPPDAIDRWTDAFTRAAGDAPKAGPDTTVRTAIDRKLDTWTARFWRALGGTD